MKLDIFLENERLDMDDAANLAITYRFSDLTNPTTQTGDYSTKFTIKGTPHNNAVFGQIWRLDRVALLGGDFNTSVYFNPSKRTNCVIFINNEVFKRGYVQLNSIKNDKGTISYDVTFYSEMVDVLRTLNESKLRDLPFPNDLRHTLNAATIRTSWEQTAAGGVWDYLTYIMANNGLYEDFESGKWLTGSVTDPQVTDILPNGLELDECAKREYRSYYQRPALRLRGLIELIAEQHGIQLDPIFFNDNNPYFADSVMALPQYNIMEQETSLTGEASYGTDTQNILTWSDGQNNDIIRPTFRSDNGDGIIPEEWSNALDFGTITESSSVVIEMEFELVAHLKKRIGPQGYLFFTGEETGVTPSVIFTTEEKSTTIKPNVPLDAFSMQSPGVNAYADLCFNYNASNDTAILYCRKNGLYPNYGDTTRIPVRFIVPKDEIQGISTISVKLTNESGDFPNRLIYWYSMGDLPTLLNVDVDYYEARLYPITKAPDAGGNLNEYYPASAGFIGADISIYLTKNIRSGYAVDKRDVIDDETTQGDFLINYAKLFGLIFYTDKDGTPHLVTRNTFFEGYKVEDWTQKIDHAKAMAQTPISFDAKYLSMRYQSGETYYEEYYKHQYGTEYGEQRIDTGYEFNTEETEILPDTMFYNTVMSQESTRVLIEKNGAVVMQFMQDTKTLPALFVKEDNQRNPSDTKFNLLFDNGQHKFVKSGNWQDIPADERIWLTDDTEGMIKAEGGGQICWIDTEHYHPVAESPDSVLIPELVYPVFSTLHKSRAYSWHLGYPLENYAGWTRSDFPESSTIYANFWRNYITEIYDVDNRILTAYVRLTAADIAQFSFGNFVKIGNTLWHVNEIDQFNPLGNGLTKVEFLRVSSLAAIENAYKNGQTDMSAIIPPEPEPEPETFNITLDLTNVASSEPNTTVEEGETFTAILDADTGYKIDSIVVTMGNTDITSQTIGGVKVWQPNANNSGGTVSIPSVTGDVTITASAIYAPEITFYNGIESDDSIIISTDGGEYEIVFEDEKTITCGNTFTITGAEIYDTRTLLTVGLNTYGISVVVPSSDSSAKELLVSSFGLNGKTISINNLEPKTIAQITNVTGKYITVSVYPNMIQDEYTPIEFLESYGNLTGTAFRIFPTDGYEYELSGVQIIDPNDEAGEVRREVYPDENGAIWILSSMFVGGDEVSVY